MNIFALHPDPTICASYHCDQHLHKMILESAQMLSTAGHIWLPNYSKFFYKPAHPNHPCTKWVCANKTNALWLIELCKELENIRDSLNCAPHASSIIIKILADWLYDEDFLVPSLNKVRDPFIFAGPDHIRLRPDLDVHQKYEQAYILKYKLWAGTSKPMSYKSRPLPKFLSQFSESIKHGN